MRFPVLETLKFYLDDEEMGLTGGSGVSAASGFPCSSSGPCTLSDTNQAIFDRTEEIRGNGRNVIVQLISQAVTPRVDHRGLD
jgi:hypothetical protein